VRRCGRCAAAPPASAAAEGGRAALFQGDRLPKPGKPPLTVQTLPPRGRLPIWPLASRHCFPHK
jgi:hypothetical protein